jgi:hypothetical protein
VYRYAFGFATEKGQKSLALDTAFAMWRLLFDDGKWPLLDHWCDFLTVRAQFTPYPFRFPPHHPLSGKWPLLDH